MYLPFRRLGALLMLSATLHLIPAAAAPVDPLRLTHEVIPVAQSVALTIDPAKDDFSGQTIIDLLASEPFTSFRLHAEGPTFTTATLTNAGGQVTSLVAVVSDAKHGLMTLTAPAQLPAGNYKLNIDFTAPYRRDGLGLYKAVSQGDAYVFSQFEDIHARKCFPCWDEPAFKINWVITATVPAALEVVSNAPVAFETRERDWKTVSFGRTPPMPAYLVALGVGPLEYHPVPGLSVPGRIVTPRGQAAMGAAAARITPAILARLEDYFGIPYPYAKLDQLAVPEFVYGGMENAGLIIYTDKAILLDPEKPGLNAQTRLAGILAHEIAHMWFGDLVTMAWWDDLWLNESFADWIATKVVEQQFPELRKKLRDSLAVKRVMLTDALPSVPAIKRPVTADSDLAQIVDDLTYSKGKGVLDMVENWIGPAKFRTAMRAYFIKHSWGNTRADDLWAALSAESGDDLTALLSGFINQPGVPLVTFALEADGKLRLTQRRFHNLGDAQLPGQWQVPIILRWSKGGVEKHERILLNAESQLVDIPGLASADWIYPNNGESGYYRWSLSPELNARLARQANALPPIERLGLIDNTSALFNAGLIDGSDYLAYLSAFGRDPDTEVNKTVVAKINQLENTFITDETRPVYNAYRAAMYQPLLDRIGLQPVPDEPAGHGPLRSDLYAALGQDAANPAIVAECRRLTALLLAQPGQVDPSLRATALNVAAYHGDAQLFTELQAALVRSNAPTLRGGLLGALGDFHDPVLARQALDFSLTPALNSTDFLTILTRVSNDPALYQLTVNWIIANYAAIAAKAPPEYTARLINSASGAEPALFNQLRDFLLAPERTTEFSAINIKKAGERVANRQRLREKEQANILQFLRTYPGQTPKD